MISGKTYQRLLARNRTPIKRKEPRRTKTADAAYLAWVHTQPCVLESIYCSGPVEVHHAGDHGLSQRAPDRTAIPLCRTHHRDGGRSVHVMGRRFWAHHALDRDRLIADLNAAFDAEHA